MLRRHGQYRTVSILGIIVILFVGVYGLQRKIELKVNTPLSERLLLSLPSGNYLKSAALGFDVLVADLIWSYTVVTFGEHFVTDQDYTGLYNSLDIITVLDPLFNDAYHLGSIMLAMQAGQVDESLILLERGLKYYPDDWRLQFITGFNYIYYKKDDAKALKYFERAADLPGHPAYLPRLISNLYAKFGKIDLSLAFLEEAYEKFDKGEMRAEIAARIKELVVEKHLIILEDAAEMYKKIYRKYPDTLEALIQSFPVLASLDEPHGGRYVIDPQTGEVISAEFLFSIESAFQRHLDNGNEFPSEDLRKKFADSGITLSEDAIISVEKRDSEWLVTDKKELEIYGVNNEQMYAVRKEEGQLSIYSIRGACSSSPGSNR